MHSIQNRSLFVSAAILLGCAGQALAQECVDPNVVTTVAGKAEGGAGMGYVDGPGVDARLYLPLGSAVDRAGNLYFLTTSSLDYGRTSMVVRKMTPAGDVSTVAGDSTQPEGLVDGRGKAARFNASAKGVAADTQGNLYVADARAIRKITPDGMVTTIAGSTEYGQEDGRADRARFWEMQDITVDAAGNVYVLDTPGRVRKLTTDGRVLTLAGDLRGHADGQGPAAAFSDPQGLAVSPAGDIFVADGGNSTIRHVTPGGYVRTIAGLAGARSRVDGPAALARFSWPIKITLGAGGALYVSDLAFDGAPHSIRRISEPLGAAVVSTVAGGSTSGWLPADGQGAAAQIDGVMGMSHGRDDAGSNVVWLTDGNRIRKLGCGKNGPPYGLTFAVPRGGSSTPGGVRLSCHGEPAPLDHPHAGSCNPYEGDTTCRAALPIACYRPSGSAETAFPRPFNWPRGILPGLLGATRPVTGSSLTSAAQGTAICRAELGSTWRMAEFHDGGGWAIDAMRASNFNPGTRYWVHINDQAGNCWGR